MNQKGIATAVIAVIVVVVIAVVGVGVYLLTRGPSVRSTEIEGITGSTKVSSIGGKSATGFMSDLITGTAHVSISEAKLAEVFAVDIYKSTESVTNIVNHYKSKWQGEGYTQYYSAENYNLSAMGYYNYIECGYLKGDQVVGVSALTYQNENYYILYAASKSALEGLFGTGGGGGPGGGIAAVTSVDMKIDVTSQGQPMTMRFRAKNLDTPDYIKFRVDGTMGQEFVMVVDAGADTVHMYGAGQWMDLSENFQAYFSQFQPMFAVCENQLSGWTGGELTLTDPTTGEPVRFYDIVLNPELPDSLFQPSGGTIGGGIATATSLSFDISTTMQGQTITAAVKMKNIGASNMKVYEEGTMAGQGFKLIVDFGTRSYWMWSSGTGWQDLSSTWESIQSYITQFDDLMGQLAGWTGGNYSYIDLTTGVTTTMSNIVVNPDISDSVFQPS